MEELVNGAPQREYTYGLQRIDEDQVIHGAWVPSFYGYDGFGTVRQLTNAAGAVTDSYEYDAFGNQITHTGSTPNNYLYRGEQWDPDLSLYYLRARYYNPQTGRFMSRDPEDGNLRIPATLHKYVYAGGDPVNALDPSGREVLIGFRLNASLILAVTTEVTAPMAAVKYGSLACLGVEAAFLYEHIDEVLEWLATREAGLEPDDPVDFGHEWCEEYKGLFGGGF